MVGLLAHMGMTRNEYDILVSKSEGKTSLWRQSGLYSPVQWQDLMNMVMNQEVPCKTGKFLTAERLSRYQGRTLFHGGT
jgi:hypothetical protein